MEVTRKQVLVILKKMKVEYTSKISKERAIKKLGRALEKHPLPKNLSDEDREVLKSSIEGWVEPKPEKETVQKKEGVRKNGALAYFKEQWENRDTWRRKHIVQEFMERFGDKAQWAAANYIARAKKDEELLGVLLVEKKDDEGGKILVKATD